MVMSHAQSLGSNDYYDSTKVVLIDFAPKASCKYDFRRIHHYYL